MEFKTLTPSLLPTLLQNDNKRNQADIEKQYNNGLSLYTVTKLSLSQHAFTNDLSALVGTQLKYTLIKLDLSHNKIVGDLRLEAMKKLASVNLSHNFLDYVCSSKNKNQVIIGLPKQMKDINLSHNPFAQKTVKDIFNFLNDFSEECPLISHFTLFAKGCMEDKKHLNLFPIMQKLWGATLVSVNGECVNKSTLSSMPIKPKLDNQPHPKQSKKESNLITSFESLDFNDNDSNITRKRSPSDDDTCEFELNTLQDKNCDESERNETFLSHNDETKKNNNRYDIIRRISLSFSQKNSDCKQSLDSDLSPFSRHAYSDVNSFESIGEQNGVNVTMTAPSLRYRQTIENARSDLNNCSTQTESQLEIKYKDSSTQMELICERDHFEKSEKDEIITALKDKCEALKSLLKMMDEKKSSEKSLEHLHHDSETHTSSKNSENPNYLEFSRMWRDECFKALLARNVAIQKTKHAESKLKTFQNILNEREKVCRKRVRAANEKISDIERECKHRQDLLYAQMREVEANMNCMEREYESMKLKRDKAMKIKQENEKELKKFIHWAKKFSCGYINHSSGQHGKKMKVDAIKKSAHENKLDLRGGEPIITLF